MDMFRLAPRHVDGGVVVELVGELDISGAPQVQATLRQFSHRYDRGQITFDCQRLTFVDSAGLVSLVEALRPFSGGGSPTLRNLGRRGRLVLDAIDLREWFLVDSGNENAAGHAASPEHRQSLAM